MTIRCYSGVGLILATAFVATAVVALRIQHG